jgi:hypothetical protein
MWSMQQKFENDRCDALRCTFLLRATFTLDWVSSFKTVTRTRESSVHYNSLYGMEFKLLKNLFYDGSPRTFECPFFFSTPQIVEMLCLMIGSLSPMRYCDWLIYNYLYSFSFILFLMCRSMIMIFFI